MGEPVRKTSEEELLEGRSPFLEKIKELYDKGFHHKEIRERLGLSRAQYYYYLGRLGLPMLPRRGAVITKVSVVSTTGTLRLHVPHWILKMAGAEPGSRWRWHVDEKGRIVAERA